RLTRAAYFMPLRAEGETGQTEIGAYPPASAERRLPAPWAGWFDRRRPRTNWLAFCQALAFYAWLRGHNIHYRTQPNGQPLFGVRGPDEGSLCWLGTQEWTVNHDAGRDLGVTLWRAFLDAGGPWPIEFQLHASPQNLLCLKGKREEYLRQGPRCQQVW